MDQRAAKILSRSLGGGWVIAALLGFAGALAHELYRFERTKPSIWKANRTKYLVVGGCWIVVGTIVGMGLGDDRDRFLVFLAGAALPEIVGFAILNVEKVFGALTGAASGGGAENKVSARKQSEAPDGETEPPSISTRTELRRPTVSVRDGRRSWLAVISESNTWRN